MSESASVRPSNTPIDAERPDGGHWNSAAISEIRSHGVDVLVPPGPPAQQTAQALAPSRRRSAADVALYLCAVTTGPRQGELLALTWIDVDWLARRIRVADNFPRGHTEEADTPKSHLLRSVPMADRLAAGLERHFHRSSFRADHDLVFCNQGSEARPAQGFSLA